MDELRGDASFYKIGSKISSIQEEMRIIELLFRDPRGGDLVFFRFRVFREHDNLAARCTRVHICAHMGMFWNAISDNVVCVIWMSGLTVD